MPATLRYSFRIATDADLDLLLEWQSRPHVSKWWDSVEPSEPEEFRDPRVARWIVTIDERPFAYMQDYTVHGWEGHPFFDFPRGSRGIDQFIGEPDLVEKGHGSAFIAERVRTLFDQGAPVVVTDPHPENARAIASYKKVGFKECGPARETPWGRIIPMRINR